MKRRDTVAEERIYQTARQMFIEIGYSGTTIRDITDKLSDRFKTPMAYYGYFKSKKELYDRIIKEYVDLMEKDITCCLDDPTEILNLTNKFIWLFMGINTFFHECQVIGGPSSPNHDEFNQSVVAYMANKIEEVLQILLKEAAWDYGMLGADEVAKMAAGIIERTALFILGHNREQPMIVPIYNFSSEAAERIMLLCSFPEDIRVHVMERIRKAAEDKLDYNKISPAECTGKEYTVDALKECIRRLSWTADIVRIVNPGPCRVLVLGENGKITEGDRCHGFWYREDRCSDCVSKDCMRDGQCHEKDEELDGYLFHIVSIPITLQRDDGPMMKCAIEYIQARPISGAEI